MSTLNERHPERWALGKQVFLLPTAVSKPFSITIGPDIEFGKPDWALNQIRSLADRGITHVIDIRVERNDEDEFLDLWEMNWLEQPIKYIHIPMDDDGKKVDEEVWHKVRNIAKSIVLRDESAHFYVHCHMGVNRGPSFGMALAYEYVWQKAGKERTHAGLVELLHSRDDAAAIYFPQYLKWSKAEAHGYDVASALELIEVRSKSLISTIHRKRAEESSDG